MAEVSFKTTREEVAIIDKIVDRAERLAAEVGTPFDRMTMTMDIAACHANGNPLDLARLLKAEDFDFAHDVWGIHRHIDRTTGQLTRFFDPRYSRREPTDG